MLTAVDSGAAPATTTEVLPSADLLLYLGEFEDATGDFVDPMALPEETAEQVWPGREAPESTHAAPAATTIEEDDRDDAQRPY